MSSTTVSLQPGTSVITGRPIAIASSWVLRGTPSRYDGRTKTLVSVIQSLYL